MSGPTPTSAAANPPANHVQPGRRWFAVALLVPAVLAITHYLFAPPVISHDTAIGLLTWRSMEQGAAWNNLTEPDPANISQAAGSYLTWWSPGQYLPVGLLEWAGLSTGLAAIVTGLLAAWSLAFGLRKLVGDLGAPAGTAALAALAAVASWHTLYAFGFFIGGEVALIAVWPWILLAAWRSRHHRRLQVLLLPLLFLTGSFAKLSFALFAPGVLLFLWMENSRADAWRISLVLLDGLRLAVIGLIYIAAWHFLHTARGLTPVHGDSPAADAITLAGFALNAPWFSALGIGSLAGRVFMITGLAPETGWSAWSPALLLAGLVAAVGYGLLMAREAPLLRLAGVIALTSLACLLVLLLRGAAVSLEDRHLRPAGVLLLAAAAYGCLQPGKQWRWIGIGTVALAVCIGVGASAQRLPKLRQHAVRSANDLSILDIDAASLHVLEREDQAGHIICLPELNHTPVIRHARVWRDASLLGHATAPHRGRAPALLVVLPASSNNGNQPPMALASFRDYASGEWRRISTGQWDFWQAGSP